MCGITGYITQKSTIRSDEVINKMISLIEHRGLMIMDMKNLISIILSLALIWQ